MKRILLFVCVLISLSLTTQAQNWSFTSTAGPYGGTVNDLAVASNGAVLAATQGGLYRSTDNGATWSRVIVSAQNNTIGIQDIEVSSTGTIYAVLSTSNSNQYGPFTSTDNGLTWTKLTPTGLVFIVPKKIKASPSGKLYMAFQNSAALYRSTDGGTTWQNSATVGSNINDIDIDSNNKVYLSTQSSSVQLSTNDGVNFNVASGSGGLSTSAIIYGATLDGSNNLYALSSDGPWRLLSGGGSWSSVKTGSLTDATYSGFLESDGSNLYLLNTISGKSWSATSPSGSIVWSGGNSYFVNNPNSVNAVLFQSSSAWYLGRFYVGVDKSTDSGANWATTSAGIAAITGNSARLFRTSNGRTLYANGALSFQLSIDDGTTWTWSTSTNTNRAITDFVQLSDASILAFGFGGVIRSTDQGSNWAQQTATSISNIATADGANLYNYNGLVINKSIDKGATWNSMGITGLSTGPINKLLPDNSGNLYLMYYSGTAWELWKIVNATTTAVKVTAFNAPALNDFTIVGNNIYAIGTNSLLYKSTDGGTTFSTSTISATSSKIWAYDDLNLFIQAGTGNFQQSSDGGASWITKTLNDNSLASATDVVFSSTQYLFVSTNFSVMQKSSTPVIIPTAPSGLVVSAKGIQTIDLTWADNATNETGYELEYSIGNNTSYQLGFAYRGQIVSPQNKVLLSGGMPADSVTTYYYRVRAVNSAGNSPYSNEVSSLGLLSCTSSLPDNRSWTAVATADPGSTASGAGPFTNNAVSIQKTGKNSFTVSLFDLGVVPASVGLTTPVPGFFTETCGKTYFNNDNFGQMYANGLGTWNSGTNTLTLKWQVDPTYYTKFEGTTTLTLNATDPIPVSPTATAYIITGTQNLLVWTSVPFATQYDIFRSTTSGSFGTTPLATLNYPTIQYVDSPVTPGTTYYYTVKAKNAAGSSAASAQTSVTPPVSTLFTPVANSLALITENQQGIAWGDLDGDGDEDYISASFQTSTGAFALPVLFENVGSNQFTRRPLAVLTGENVGVYRGASVVDVNNDGKLDVYFPRQGNNTLADLVLLNNGSWNFTKVIVTPSSSYANFRAASLADYDRDGLVDVLITDTDASGVAVPPILLKNTSAGGNLSVSAITSAGTLTSNAVISREVSWADFNNDGLQDALVPFYNANASTPSPNVPNRLYKNNGDGTFSVVTGTVFDTDIFFQARTVSWGDIDNDGDLDLFIGSQQGVNVADRLYQNNGNGTFTSITASPVAEVGTQSFGSAFGDIDNDGDLDLIVINNVGGNSIFINGGGPSYAFTKYTGTELLNSAGLGNIGGGFVDYDKDGFLDVATGRNSGYVPPYLYRNTNTASSSKNWIEIKLIGTVSNYAAIGARISVKTTSPARTQIREVSARTGYGSQSSLIQHFGLGTATSISEIKVTWPNGGVQTWTSPPAGQTVNQVVTITEDLTGPTFTFNPANGATGVALGNTISFTLNEAGTPVGGKNILIRTVTSTSTPVQTIAVSSGAVAGNTYTYTLSGNLSPLTTYFIELDAGAFTDIYGNASLAVAPTAWSFTTLDNVAPTVSFTPPASIQKGSITGTTFSVTASDNVAVASVIMSYRKITATQYQTLNGTFNATSSKYDFPLQATFFDDMGMEYYFTAADGSGNSATSPASGTHITRIGFSPTTIALAVPAGSSAADYKIISIPLDLATTNIPNIFADFGAADVTAWKLLKYQDSPQAWITYPSFSAVAKGEGYFIISRVGHNLAFDQAVAPSYSQSNLFQLNLIKGFNLIGNPYMMPINWDDSRAGVTGVNAVKLYQSGNYVDGNTIDVFSGGFVFANAAVTVPVKLKTSPNGGRVVRPSYTSRIDADEWIVPIIMTQGQRQFNFGGVGMSPKASLSYDDMDDLAPPSPMGKLEMEFAHPEHFMKKFSRDVVPTASGFTWTFVAASDESAPVEMKWNNTEFAESGKDLWLFDVALQRPVNMKTESSYSFSPGVSKEFKVYYGKDAAEQLKPQRVFLGLPTPNPASGAVSIPFTLPDNNAQMNVLMEVFDMTGRQVQTLLDKSLPGGFYTAGWDAGASTVGSGFYIVKLAVSYQDRQEVAATKLIIHK
ncbi:MAG: VCBS repeat-containing protein [Bacteroidetes bacterium]|nr:VCBS repeat-containing protein [Bacteroidota bacterium]